MNIAFAGFRHGHIFSLFKWANENPDVNIVAAFEEDIKARSSAAERGVSFTHDNYDEMLLDESIDAVAIGDYFAARGGRIIKALRAGKHVITDKPVCTERAELEEIEKITKETGLKLGCMLDLRYMFATAKAKELIEGGTLGNIHNIIFGGQHPLNYGSRADWYFEEGKQGGTINDIAIHGIDLISFICGKRLHKVIGARCWNAYAKEEPDFLDSAQFMAEFDSNTGVIADVSYCVPSNCTSPVKQVWRFDFWGENGVLEMNIAENTLYLNLKDSAEIQIFKGENPNDNPLCSFVRDIEGKPDHLNTNSVIASTSDTLKIQESCCK